MRRWAVAVVVVMMAAACGSEPATASANASPSASATDGRQPEAGSGQPEAGGGQLDSPPTSRPSGGRDLPPVAPLQGDEVGTWVVGAAPLEGDGPWETPPQLRERSLTAPGEFPPPPDGGFSSSVAPVPDEVATRSTWRPECPVGLEDLRYLTLSFWGFDGKAHTGEMVVHASAAAGAVEVFERLFEARFPIEEMRVIRLEELDLPATGDGNVTTSFVCRPVVGGSSTWSQHAYGLAIDVNPFQNPYRKGDLVLPELASAYLDREWVRPGMVVEGDVVTMAFADIGWIWGGTWRTLEDTMHFSVNGR